MPTSCQCYGKHQTEEGTKRCQRNSNLPIRCGGGLPHWFTSAKSARRPMLWAARPSQLFSPPKLGWYTLQKLGTTRCASHPPLVPGGLDAQPARCFELLKPHGYTHTRPATPMKRPRPIASGPVCSSGPDAAHPHSLFLFTDQPRARPAGQIKLPGVHMSRPYLSSSQTEGTRLRTLPESCRLEHEATLFPCSRLVSPSG